MTQRAVLLENNAAVRMDAALVRSPIQLPSAVAVALPIAARNFLFFHFRGRIPMRDNARAAFLFRILQYSSGLVGLARTKNGAH
jgi:hypothetical protein